LLLLVAEEAVLVPLVQITVAVVVLVVIARRLSVKRRAVAHRPNLSWLLPLVSV
jgi:beta-lactamase regulating signal transducer with metallopeptidase domain